MNKVSTMKRTIKIIFSKQKKKLRWKRSFFLSGKGVSSEETKASVNEREKHIYEKLQ